MSKFKFMIYPAWFGGADEADKAVVELAEHQAKHERLIPTHRTRAIADIWVDRHTDPNCWRVTVEFIA